MLLFVNSDQLAEELYKVMSEFLEDIYKGKREIWPPAEIKSPDSEEPSSSSSTNLPSPGTIPPNLIGTYAFHGHNYGTSRLLHRNFLILEPRFLHSPEEHPSDWKLDAFTFSSK